MIYNAGGVFADPARIRSRCAFQLAMIAKLRCSQKVAKPHPNHESTSSPSPVALTRRRMKKRPYANKSDLDLLQDFASRSLAKAKGCGYLHPGDIPHRLFNGNKHFSPSDVLTIWEDSQGIAAWILAEPRHRCFDAQIRFDLKGSGFAAEILAFAEARTLALMNRYEINADKLWADAFRCDIATSSLLSSLGWTQDPDSTWTENRRHLVGLPEPALPRGFHIRSARGIDEAEKLAAVHAASFAKAQLTPELYRKVMESPGYDPSREYVVVAPDGAFAAFTVTWHDSINRTGLFEPVGTHAEYRRLGLARAVMVFAMREMAEAGLEQAVVLNENSNDASRGLYRSCGFLPWQQIDDYFKPILL